MHSYGKLITILLVIPTLLMARTNITGGGVVMFDNGRSEGGFNIEYSQFKFTPKKISIGGRIAYNRWSREVSTFSSFNGALETKEEVYASNIFELAPAVRFISKQSTYTQFFLEPSAGFNLLIMSSPVLYTSQDDRVRETEGAFGLSLAAGFDFKRIEVKPAYKMYFKDKDAVKWVSIAMGISL